MAHNISEFTDSQGVKRRGLYSLRKSAWHELGTVVEKPLSDPGILEAAGLNWTANLQGMYRQDMQPVEGYSAVTRSDDGRQLGVVGSKYTPLQNEALFAFFRDVAGLKDCKVETAGSLGNGETVWAMARLDGLTLEKGDDISQGYLLIRNSHDGSSTVRVCPTMVRVVCANTLAMSATEERRRKRRYGSNTLSGGYQIRHTYNLLLALQDVADAYARTMADYEATRAAFSALTSKPLSAAAFDAMMAAAFKASDAAPNESKAAATIAATRKDKVQAILASATCNVQGTAGTLWAGLNAITEYIDHDSRTRSNGTNSAAQRFASACFDGAGAKAKEAAYATALSLV